MKKHIFIHCPNKCFEAMSVAQETLVKPEPIVSDWICSGCGSVCLLEFIDLEQKIEPETPPCAKCYANKYCVLIRNGNCDNFKSAKPYSPPPLQGKKETVTCIGMACQAFRPDSGGRCISPNGCGLNDIKASDYVATESEKKEPEEVIILPELDGAMLRRIV